MAVDQVPVAPVSPAATPVSPAPRAADRRTDALLDLVARESEDPTPSAHGTDSLGWGLLWALAAAVVVIAIAFWMSSGHWISRYIPR